jgi:Tol biopolymer transport system component
MVKPLQPSFQFYSPGTASTMRNSDATRPVSGIPDFARIIFPLTALMVVLLTGPLAAWQEKTTKPAVEGSEERFFRNVRQLTSAGKRSGEGYFSADGRMMVFQSEREPGNPFYQIYLLDFESGDINRVSPGQGKTTCAWIHPDGKRVMFSSTHADPDSVKKQEVKIKERAEGKEGRYSWDYDPEYEIYVCEIGKEGYTNLTNAKGYCAEGSFSPDGTKIAFASNRRAYVDGELSEEERKLFDMNASAVMDIYIMDADGSNVQRLTDMIGYDGGPFFSPDGKRICWRHFAADLTTAEIWTMNIDGTDKRQLTELGATSFGPYYHPSNKYLIFQSNPEGYANFENYIIPVEGRMDPIRVTWTDGFDGFPVFSPDGKTFAWTSNRNGNISQIFAAEWDHEEALRALGYEKKEGTDTSDKAAPETDTSDDEKTGRESLKVTSANFVAADVMRHVDYLCRPELEGRLTGTAGERRATAYFAAYLDSLDFLPAGDIDEKTGKPGWYQYFDYPAGAKLGENNSLKINEEVANLETDWMPLNFSGSGNVSGKVSFAGYGIVAPGEGDKDGYDSFVHLDITDKWVMVFRFLPENVSPERRQELNLYSQLRMKAANVRDRGGKGLIIVSGPNSGVKREVIELGRESSAGMISIPVISISDEIAAKIMKLANQDLKWWQSQLDSGEPQIGFDFPDLVVSANVEVIQQKGRGRNVIGRLQAGDAPTSQSVLLGAHIDHLGRGASGTMARDESEKNMVHTGADDNASGIAGILEIAQYLAAEKRAGKLKAQRDLVIAAWSGEELGLFGSAHFVKQHQAEIHGNADKPASDPASSSINSRFSACINLDMIGRFSDKLVLQGLGSSDYWATEIEKRNLVTALPLQQSQDTNLPTDAAEFYRAGVPILSAFTGTHEDYHTPRDTPEKLDYEAAAKIARLLGLITRSLMISEEAPVWKENKQPDTSMRFAGRASLGTSPDYGTDVVGTMIKSVRSGSPAEKAGIQGSDVVIELAGRKIENVYDYTNAIGALKVGETVKVVILRKGERIELDITPESRD